MAIEKIAIEQAVGTVVAHDLTGIVKGKSKGPVFKKGHVIKESDLSKLRKIGKNHLFVLKIDKGQMHEDEAAIKMARAAAGPGIFYDQTPSEGKINFYADMDGIFEVNVEALQALNMLGDVAMATRHTHSVVKKGEMVAGCRAIPLVVDRDFIDQAVSIAQEAGNILKVKPWAVKKAAVVITGQEVYEGRIKDAFGPILSEKLSSFGVTVLSTVIVPDQQEKIANSIKYCIEMGAELVITTGGMSVDPDDVTRAAIVDAGAEDVVYGSPVLPGSMFLVGYIEGVVVVGLPACGMYFKTTVLDIVLPRILAGERIGRKEIASLGHGGLCLGCKSCRFPICPFGKG